MTKYIYIIGLTLSSFNASFLFGGQKHTEKERQKQEQIRAKLKKEFNIRQLQIKKMGKKMRMKEINEAKSRNSNERMYVNLMENNNVKVADMENMKADIEEMRENIKRIVSVVKKLTETLSKHTESITKVFSDIRGLYRWVMVAIFRNILRPTVNNDTHSIVANT